MALINYPTTPEQKKRDELQMQVTKQAKQMNNVSPPQGVANQASMTGLRAKPAMAPPMRVQQRDNINPPKGLADQQRQQMPPQTDRQLVTNENSNGINPDLVDLTGAGGAVAGAGLVAGAVGYGGKKYFDGKKLGIGFGDKLAANKAQRALIYNKPRNFVESKIAAAKDGLYGGEVNRINAQNKINNRTNDLQLKAELAKGNADPTLQRKRMASVNNMLGNDARLANNIDNLMARDINMTRGEALQELAKKAGPGRSQAIETQLQEYNSPRNAGTRIDEQLSIINRTIAEGVSGPERENLQRTATNLEKLKAQYQDVNLTGGFGKPRGDGDIKAMIDGYAAKNPNRAPQYEKLSQLAAEGKLPVNKNDVNNRAFIKANFPELDNPTDFNNFKSILDDLQNTSLNVKSSNARTVETLSELQRAEADLINDRMNRSNASQATWGQRFENVVDGAKNNLGLGGKPPVDAPAAGTTPAANSPEVKPTDVSPSETIDGDGEPKTKTGEAKSKTGSDLGTGLKLTGAGALVDAVANAPYNISNEGLVDGLKTTGYDATVGTAKSAYDLGNTYQKDFLDPNVDLVEQAGIIGGGTLNAVNQMGAGLARGLTGGWDFAKDVLTPGVTSNLSQSIDEASEKGLGGMYTGFANNMNAKYDEFKNAARADETGPVNSMLGDAGDAGNAGNTSATPQAWGQTTGPEQTQPPAANGQTQPPATAPVSTDSTNPNTNPLLDVPAQPQQKPLGLNSQLENGQGVVASDNGRFRREIRSPEEATGLANSVNTFDSRSAINEFEQANQIRKQGIADRKGVPLSMAYATPAQIKAYKDTNAVALGDGTFQANQAAGLKAQLDAQQSAVENQRNAEQDAMEYANTINPETSGDVIRKAKQNNDLSMDGVNAASDFNAIIERSGKFKNFFNGLPQGVSLGDLEFIVRDDATEDFFGNNADNILIKIKGNDGYETIDLDSDTLPIVYRIQDYLANRQDQAQIGYGFRQQ